MAEIGDLVNKSGIYTKPGVVTKKNIDGTVSISTEPLKVSEFHRYAYTTGLNELDKSKFNQILDEIYTKPDGVDRINGIQMEIDRLKSDPQSSNVVQYLRNQQAVLIRETRELPSEYKWDEAQLR